MKIISLLSFKSATFVLALTLPMLLVACEKNAENPAIKNSETVTEQKDVSMSAAPADKKEAPIAVADGGKAVADKAISMPDSTVVTTTTTKEKTVTTDKPDAKKSNAKNAPPVEEEDEEDNSGMDSISEDDEVVDDSPASPDAPTAKDEPAKSSKAPADKAHHATSAKHK